MSDASHIPLPPMTLPSEKRARPTADRCTLERFSCCWRPSSGGISEGSAMSEISDNESTNGNGEPILIVDDEKNIRRTLRMVLEGEGHAVHEAGSIAEAEARARAASTST